MKAFNFGLEKVLRLRKHREDEAKLELGRAVGLLSELETRISVLGRARAEAAASQFAPENSAAEIKQYMYYLSRLDTAKEQLLREAAQAELKVEEARDAFIEASGERKVLDNLKEKRQKEYKKETLKAENKALDDISSAIAITKVD